MRLKDNMVRKKDIFKQRQIPSRLKGENIKKTDRCIDSSLISCLLWINGSSASDL